MINCFDTEGWNTKITYFFVFFPEKCSKGSYSSTGLEPTCRKCDYGEYQSEIGKAECMKCPVNTTTFSRGATNLADCAGLSHSFYLKLTWKYVAIKLKSLSAKRFREEGGLFQWVCFTVSGFKTQVFILVFVIYQTCLHLSENYPNTEFFGVRFSLCLDWI